MGRRPEQTRDWLDELLDIPVKDTLPEQPRDWQVPVVDNWPEQSGDWQCPKRTCINHHKFVFASKTCCPRCGSQRGMGYFVPQFESPFPKVHTGPRLPSSKNGADDWPCPNGSCIFHTKLVYGNRPSCPSCCAAKDATCPGDWICPNKVCLNSKNTVFASKSACPRCGTPRPTNGRIEPSLGPFPMHVPRQTLAVARDIPMRPRAPRVSVTNGFDVAANAGDGWHAGTAGDGWHADTAGDDWYPDTTGDAWYPHTPGDDWYPDASCMNNAGVVFAEHANVLQGMHNYAIRRW